MKSEMRPVVINQKSVVSGVEYGLSQKKIGRKLMYRYKMKPIPALAATNFATKESKANK